MSAPTTVNRWLSVCPAGADVSKPPIAGLLPEELESSLPLSPAFRARQVFQWVARGAVSFDQMTNLARPLRAQLADMAAVRTVTVNQTLTDEDGTVKLQLRLADGAMVESVVMSERGRLDTILSNEAAHVASSTEQVRGRYPLGDPDMRHTVCLSTQVGCACGCKFCMTGTLGLDRNLTAGEIVEQFLIAEGTAPIDNIVLMGMGEPLLNLAAVRKALAVLSDPRGRALSLRRVTLSTCGIIEGIDDLAASGPYVRLAVSLTTADEVLRQVLMPMARTNPLSDLRRAIARYAASSGRRVTLEAAMLGGVNTTRGSADRLIAFAQGLDVNINLIPWNAVPQLPFSSPSPQEVAAFTAMLQSAGLNVTVRAHHGRGVGAACGQLGETHTHNV